MNELIRISSAPVRRADRVGERQGPRYLVWGEGGQIGSAGIFLGLLARFSSGNDAGHAGVIEDEAQGRLWFCRKY